MPNAAATDLVIDHLKASVVRAAAYNPNDADEPAAILWADPESRWQPVVAQLQRSMPQLLSLGDYEPEDRAGPAIWLRCAVDGAAQPPDGIPVLYLPGVGRQDIASADSCPKPLKPLVELQYRGVCWTQKNGKDWTVEAFLTSADGGLGLDVARDAATRQAMHGALQELANTSLGELEGRHIDAEFLNRLLSDDPVRDLLQWLNDDESTKRSWDAARWQAFKSHCGTDLAFDPDKEGVLIGAERLGRRDGGWASVWKRFEEAPSLYPNIPELLRRAMPDDLLAERSSWPQYNEQDESGLRKQLRQLEDAAPAQARSQLLELEGHHGERRGWIWAKLGHAPLAFALEHLVTVAKRTTHELGGATAEEMGSLYADDAKGAWRVDAAAMDAMGAVKSSADTEAVSVALRTVYLPWLEAAALHFQTLAAKEPLPDHASQDADQVAVAAGGVVLFADGLRFDVAQRLAERLGKGRRSVSMDTRWAALPTVTATAKHAVSPVASEIVGRALREDFWPDLAADDRQLNTDRFRKLLDAGGYQFLRAGDTGDPGGMAWTEDGNLDKQGHNLQGKLAGYIDDDLDRLLERIDGLLDAGWREVCVVTDHGWLWLPGGLPKVSLPKYLTQTRWSRCASIKGESSVAVPTVGWHWNIGERVAVGPGIACFEAGNEYAHGGLSLQECLLPVLRVSSGKRSSIAAKIAASSWVGLRCRVRVEGATPGVCVDLRTHVGSPGSSVSGKRPLDDQGAASLLVANDDLEGTSAVLVVLDTDGKVIARQATIIGGGEEE